MNGWGKIFLQLLQMVWLCLVTQQDNYRYLSPNVREQSLSKIWYEFITGFNHFVVMHGCQEGCRSCQIKTATLVAVVVVYMLTGDASNADPVCGKSLYHQLIEQARAESEIDSSLGKLVFHVNSRNSKSNSQFNKTFQFKNIVEMISYEKTDMNHGTFPVF